VAGQRLETHHSLAAARKWCAGTLLPVVQDSVWFPHHVLVLPLLAGCGHPVNPSDKILRAFAQ